MLTQMCTKLNKFFNDGKQYKALLEVQPQHGKQLMQQSRNAPLAAALGLGPVRSRDDTRQYVRVYAALIALNALADNLQMQKPKKTTPETKTQRRAGFHFVIETRIVQPQFCHGFAQILKLA